MNVSGVPRYRWLQRYIVDDLPHSRVFNILKRPLSESWWIQSVKFVQHWNYVMPILKPSTRNLLMKGCRDDLRELSENFDFDTSSWQNVGLSQ